MWRARLLADAGRDLRAHRLRTFLSALSLFVGVLAVVAVTAIGAVVEDVFVANAEQHDGRKATVGVSLPLSAMNAAVPGIVAVLDHRVRAAGGDYALVAAVQAQVSGNAAATHATAVDGFRPQRISLVAGDPAAIRRLPVLDGRWPDCRQAALPGGIVVNQAGRDTYGGVGTELSVQPSPLFPPYPQRIVGVIADGLAAPELYLPLPTAEYLQPGILPADTPVTVQIHAAHTGEAVLRQDLGDVLTDLGVDGSGIEIRRLDTVDTLLSAVRQTRTMFGLIAAVMLAIAALGQLNIGLATVRERHRELTVRRALGSTRARMFALVLLSSLAAGLLAALAAIGVAAATVTVVIPHVLDPAEAISPPAFPVGSAVAGLAAALAAGLAGGLAPAIAAARVDMAHVLRE
ncbi:ABC transporter permease [Kitasatospora sp. NPDC094028]